MLLNILVQTINSIIQDIEPVDIKITTGCLLYSYLNNQPDTLNLRNKALSFKDYYYSQCVDKKITNRTVGFITIENIISNKKIKNLTEVSMVDYEKILKAFKTTELEVRFNPKVVDPKTYGRLSFKSNYEKLKFSVLHNEYLSPIALYYKNKYNIDYSDLRIVSIGDTNIPAKEVTFFIKGYPSNRAVRDMEQDLILFKNKPSLIRLTSDSFIYMIV